MSQNSKNRVLSLARKSKISELDNILRSENIHWIECRSPSGDTPLHTAAQAGNIPVMRYLIETFQKNSNTIDITNLAGKTALHEACQNSQPEAVSFLVEKGADTRAIKQADWTPLMLACTKTGERALACCQMLLRTSGPVLLNDRNKDGWNALHIAVREGDVSIVDELLLADQNSRQTSTKSNNGRTPLHTAALHGHHEVVKHLLQVSSVDCNAKDSCGATPIHDAVRNGSLDTFRALVEAGADLSVHNNEGFGIQHMAAQTGQTIMLKFLLQKLGLDTHTTSRTPPLHCAVRAGQIASLLILLDAGADPNAKDGWGRTCFDVAPENNLVEIKKILSEREMNVNLHDEHKNS